MLDINGRQVNLIGTTFFFAVSGVEENFLQIFDGFSLAKIGECSIEKIKEYQEKGKVLLFHSGAGIATTPIEIILKEVEYAQEIGAQAYSLAGGFTCSEVMRHNKYGYYLPTKGAKIFVFEEFLECGKVKIEAIKKNFPSMLIAIENLDYWLGGAYECCKAWQVIDMINHWNVSLLLDIGHMQVSAHRLMSPAEKQSSERMLKLSTMKYFEEILQALQEKIVWVHLHKAEIARSGEVFDAHSSPTDFEFDFLRLLPKLKYLTLEYPHNIVASTNRAVDDLIYFSEEKDFFNKKNWKWLTKI